MLTYILLSPTFGMHQYTADLANRAAAGDFGHLGGSVDLVTTGNWIADRYSPAVKAHLPITTHGTGFALEGLKFADLWRALTAIVGTDCRIVHFTGVHAWNLILARWLRGKGIRVVHTVHDLDPHYGVRFRMLIRLWNRLIVSSVDRVLVHGRCYADRLVMKGVPPEKVLFAPLLHLFLSHAKSRQPQELRSPERRASDDPCVLFFGRVEAYKGVDVLLHAWNAVQSRLGAARLVIAGPARKNLIPSSLPPRTEIRDHIIHDREAIELFRSASLLVLPYLDASQSALIAAAFFFGLPVLVTSVGALPEYIEQGRTGWVIPPGDSRALGAALIDALSDRERLIQLGKEGKRWYHIQRKFEAEVLAELYSGLSIP